MLSNGVVYILKTILLSQSEHSASCQSPTPPVRQILRPVLQKSPHYACPDKQTMPILISLLCHYRLSHAAYRPLYNVVVRSPT